MYSNCIPAFPNVALLIVNFLFVESKAILVPLFISSASIVNPPIVPPLNKTFEPVICPLDFNLRLLSLSFISADVISNPPIEAETVVSKPVEAIEELGVGAADGTAILSAVIAPWTVNVLFTNCKNCPEPLLPNSIDEPVTLPSLVKWNFDELISMFPLEPLIKLVDVFPKKNLGVSNVIELPLATNVSVCISMPSSNIK